MIPRIAIGLRTRLESMGCPVPVLYGPIRGSARNITTTCVVVERARTGPETIKAPTSRPTNPPMIACTEVHGRVRIYAASTVDGATVQNHERLADMIKRAVLLQLFIELQTNRTQFSLTDVTVLNPLDLEYEGLLTWPGVVMDIGFKVDEGVFDITWESAQAAETGLDEAILGTDFGVLTTRS